MVTDQQVALLRHDRWKERNNPPAMAEQRWRGSGSVARCPRRPSRNAGGAPGPIPLTASGRKKSCPCSKAGRRQAQGNDNYRVAGGEIPRPVQRLPAPHPATPITGLASAQRSGSGGLLPPRASTWPGGAARHHRRPALPPPAVPAAIQAGAT